MKKLTKSAIFLLIITVLSLQGCGKKEISSSAIEESRESINETGTAEEPDSRSETVSTSSESGTSASEDTEEESSDSGEDPQKAESEKFRAFTDRIFAELVSADTLTSHFYLAEPESYGIDTDEIVLAAPSGKTEDIQNEKEYTNGILKELIGFRYELLPESDRLTYDALYEYLENILALDDYPYLYEPLGAYNGVQSYYLLYFAAYSFYTKDDIDTYLNILEAYPGYLGEILEYEKEKAEAGLFMEDRTLENVINQCRDFVLDKEDSFLISGFEEKIDSFSLTGAERRAYTDRNSGCVEEIYTAYENLAEELEKLAGSGLYEGGLVNYPEGKEYYTALIHLNTGSDMTPEEMINVLSERTDSAFYAIVKMYSKNRALIENAQEYVFSTGTPEAVLELLKDSIRADFPVIDEVGYQIRYVDDSLSDYFSSACYFLPPIDLSDVNEIFINSEPGEEPSNLFILLAHEGYPGHLYQANYMRQNGFLPLRQLISPTGYTEGYAKYVEILSYEYADMSDELVLYFQTSEILSICMYARCDLGVNYEGWGIEELDSYVNQYFDFGIDATEWLYEYLIEDPGGYLDYAIGYIEVESLLDSEKEKQGKNFSLYDFHEKLLKYGAAPFSVIQKYIE